MTSEPHWSYGLFGLFVHSSRPLPELTPCDVLDGPDVFIRWGDVPNALPHARIKRDAFEVSTNDALLKIDGVAHFLISGGNEIWVHPMENSTDDDVRAFLLGSVLGLLCHQRGMLPLHANALVVRDRAVAIAGHSGTGKSTLAAYLLDKGYPLLTDDICVISFPEHTRPKAWPGVPSIKLWHDSAIALNKNTVMLERVFNKTDKFKLDNRTHFLSDGIELDRIYVLSPQKDGDVADIEAITGTSALAAIYEHTYRNELVDAFEGHLARFSRNVALIRSVPIYRLPWRHDYHCLPQAAAALEVHFNSIPEPIA